MQFYANWVRENPTAIPQLSESVSKLSYLVTTFAQEFSVESVHSALNLLHQFNEATILDKNNKKSPSSSSLSSKNNNNNSNRFFLLHQLIRFIQNTQLWLEMATDYAVGGGEKKLPLLLSLESIKATCKIILSVNEADLLHKGRLTGLTPANNTSQNTSKSALIQRKLYWKAGAILNALRPVIYFLLMILLHKLSSKRRRNLNLSGKTIAQSRGSTVLKWIPWLVSGGVGLLSNSFVAEAERISRKPLDASEMEEFQARKSALVASVFLQPFFDSVIKPVTAKFRSGSEKVPLVGRVGVLAADTVDCLSRYHYYTHA